MFGVQRQTKTLLSISIFEFFLWTTLPAGELKIPAFLQLTNDDVSIYSESREAFSVEGILGISAF